MCEPIIEKKRNSFESLISYFIFKSIKVQLTIKK